MLRSLYTAATGMEAQEVKMDVIAHNLANTTTTGFKKSRAEFEDLLSETIRAATPPSPEGGGSPAAAAGRPGRAHRQHHPRPGPGRHDRNPEPARPRHRGGGVLPDPAPKRRAGLHPRRQLPGRRRAGAWSPSRASWSSPGITVPPEATSLTIRPDGTVLARVPGRDGRGRDRLDRAGHLPQPQRPARPWAATSSSRAAPAARRRPHARASRAPGPWPRATSRAPTSRRWRR